MDWGPRITYLASTPFKDRVVPFGIRDSDRLKHLCILGKAGSGRGALLARIALQDVERGLGVVVLDAAGNLGPMIMERLDGAGLERLVHLDAADAEYPFSWDIVGEFKKSERGKELFMDALPSVYSVKRDALTDFLATRLLEESDKSILEPFILLSDEKARDAAFPPESEPSKQFAELRTKHADAVATITENGRYLMKDTMVRNLLGQKEGKFSTASVADGAIFVIDLSRIRIFPTRIAPLVKLFTYALRAQTGSGVYASLYLHDCLRYYTESDAESMMTDQSFALTLSDTVYRESDMPLREKVVSRCGSVVSFEPHQSDIPLVQRVFYPYVTPEELAGLEEGEACVALTIDSLRAKPFFANTLELPDRHSISLQDILVSARQKYTTPRTQVDALFKKTEDDKKKGGQPPFSDAFKNIFAKRDPAKALETGNDKKPDPSRPPAESGVQQSVVQEPAPAPTPAPATAPPSVSGEARAPIESAPRAHEVPEDELRQLLYVSPLPA